MRGEVKVLALVVGTGLLMQPSTGSAQARVRSMGDAAELPRCPPKHLRGDSGRRCVETMEDGSYGGWLGFAYASTLWPVPAIVHWVHGEFGRGLGAIAGTFGCTFVGLGAGLILSGGGVGGAFLGALAGYVGWAVHDSTSNSTIERDRVITVQRAPWTPGGSLTFQF